MRDDTRLPRGGIDPPAGRHLRLVRPEPQKPERRRSTRKRGVRPTVEDVFSPAEVARLRLAMANARARFGGWQRLADAMDVHVDTVRLAGVRHTLTAGVAYRFARTTGTTIEALLSAGLRVVEPPRGEGAA